MSSTIERRRAARLACRLPVRLLRASHVVLGHTEDLSLIGVRVRLPRAALQLAADASLGQVAACLHERLGEAFVAELAWPTLGSLVRRVLRVARLTDVGGEAGEIDLGCELRVPLGAPELQALGLTPPASSADDDAPRTVEPRQVVLARAVLMPTGAPGGMPIRAQVLQIHSDEIALAIARPERLGVPRERCDLMALVAAFHQRFGAAPQLLVMGLEEPLWAGATRVIGFEWVRGEDMLRLNVRPIHPLRHEELARLGVCVGV